VQLAGPLHHRELPAADRRTMQRPAMQVNTPQHSRASSRPNHNKDNNNQGHSRNSKAGHNRSNRTGHSLNNKGHNRSNKHHAVAEQAAMKVVDTKAVNIVKL